ncbi:MAG: hypothetical protein PHC61_06330 [Chitinivibrionales bacterium]|nr:hypothetical protein [Chitinivibrionales bacterium]
MMRSIIHRLRAWLWCGALFFTAGGGLGATTLRVHSAMHTGIIGRISIDKSGQYLLSCSIDKTAKFWNAASGELLRTFYPPSGQD